MNAIDPDGFEAMFRENVDPWDYAGSPFEAYKRRILLRACGARIYGRVLELACANGETTKALRPRSLRLCAVDGSSTALGEAARRTQGLSKITLRHALLPRDMPKGPFDLIVVSELLYYLKSGSMTVLLRKLKAALAPGGRIVILHHVLDFDDAAQLPKLAQARATAFFRRRTKPVYNHRNERFDASAFVHRASRRADQPNLRHQKLSAW